MKTNKRSGFTLVEMVLASVITAIIMGALTAIYANMASTTARSLAKANVLLQTETLLEDMEVVASQASVIQVVAFGGRTAMKCTMPLNGADTNNDGVLDTFTPDSVSRRQIPKYNRGLRIWYYQADATGDPNVDGTVMWKATRPDDSNPTTSDVLSSWTSYYGGANRWPLIDTVTFSIEPDLKSVRMIVRGSSLTRAEQAAGAAAVADRDTVVISLQRKVMWRNWWK